MRTLELQLATFFLILVFQSCSFGPSAPGSVAPMDYSGKFRLLPNDGISNDSAAIHLAEGVIIPAYPGASYELSFVSNVTTPPDLRLYKLIPATDTTYGYANDQLVKAVQDSGRWVYKFTCNLLGAGQWITVLENGSNRFTGQISSLHLSASGTNSNHLSFLLWVVGKYVPPDSGETPQQVALALQTTFRNMYAPDVVVDTVYVRYANTNPRAGSEYPVQTSVYATGLEARFDTLGFGLSGGEASALDLVLVPGFTVVGLLGESPLFGLNLEAGESGSVVVATSMQLSSGSAFVPSKLSDIAYTAAHEVGHFFGLHHTTATTADMAASGDSSLTNDGLGDPTCPGLNLAVGPMNKVLISRPKHLLMREWLVSLASVYNCPDLGNLMFPYAISDTTIIPALTSVQKAQIAKNLALFPH